MKKFIIITSIFEPTEAVRKFSQLSDWQLVVAGDLKTPDNWNCPGVIYLSPKDQEDLRFEITKELPWNHYCRKMVGYLYAIQQGADIIADTDDDNIPYDDWGEAHFEGNYNTIAKDSGYVNIYHYFSKEKIWPRGFPLKLINTEQPSKAEASKQQIGIWQYLADKDPDVDAVYRLVIGKEIVFDKKSPLVLEAGTLSPFNSQNTLFRKELFTLLYLPAFVTFRFTDILRGLVAQPIMWQQDLRLAFGEATVYQERNEHDFLKDFESEIPVYLVGEKVPDIVSNAISNKQNIDEALIAAYEALLEHQIIPKEEVSLLKAWISDINRVSS